MHTTDNTPALTPQERGDLVVTATRARSVAYAVATVVETEAAEFVIPRVTSDPAAGWYAEGAEIALDDAGVDQLTIRPRKVAGLTKLSNEVALDSDPAAAEIVGAGLGRDIANRLDAAFFAESTPNGPAGLLSIDYTSVDSGSQISDLDVFAAAIAAAENVGATITSFVAHPDDALVLSQLKTATDSNQPLLGAGATEALDRRVLGVPLLVSPHVAAGDVWGIPAEFVYLIQRTDTELEVDESVFFTSYSTAVRAVMRVGFGFVHPAAVVRIHDAS